jgi:transcriptional regulator with XRE-family HTH domain
LGISDSEVARRVGIAQPRYANYVNDANEPDLATLVRICRVLGTSPDVVLGFAEAARGELEEVLVARVAAVAAAIDLPRLKIAAALMDTLASMPED